MSQAESLDPLFLSFQLAVAGRYSIDREIGRGGMGVVYLAREVHLDRPVAIKLLPPERAARRTLRDRFLREARLAAKLSHPNIIPIHSVEETDGFVFYVMAFVDGETLAQRVRARGPLPSNEGARVLREVAWALAHAHEHGLIHRDVKPDNILLESSTGRVLVADFGIAAAFGDAGDGISGTPEFMSPEQALGSTLDARSDLYGLGATAFYMFSGRFPFEGKTPTEVLAKQVTEPAPPLSSLGLAVPRKLAALIDRCLAKVPEQRPESALVLAEQLGIALEKRREMPAALRAFVNRSARLDGAGTILGGFGLMLAYAAVTVTGGPIAAFATAVGGALVLPFSYVVFAARRLLQQGFAHRDVAPAFDAVLQQTREELAIDKPKHSELLERVMLRGALAAGAVYGSWILGIALRYPSSRFLVEFVGINRLNAINFIGPVCGAAALFTGIGYLALRQRHSDPQTEFWAGLWKGRVGRAAFALARKFLGRTDRITVATHRATELSLGMAAEQLYDGLPKNTRQALGDIPAVLRRLQDDAQQLRRNHDALQDALAEFGDSSSAEYAEVRETRDAFHTKLADAVGALETIRLNLLRLHAGSLSVESVTTHLELAAEVSAEVERLIAAHGEVERALKFPRTPATTPV